jgi:hypothetical protein
MESQWKIEEWDNKKLQKALDTMWDNGYTIISDKIVKMKDGLNIGSCLSPVLADIVMNEWEKKVVEKGGERLILFCRYVDDCLGVWKGTQRQLEIFISELEDVEKGIQIDTEVEECNKINYLDLKIERTREGKYETSWYQKECAAGIYCHRRSDVDDSSKKNFIKNMEKKIERINTNEKQKRKDIERFWNQLRQNGYGDEDTRRRKKEKEKEAIGERREDDSKKKSWYGIESVGRATDKIKWMLRKEGIKTYRKGGKKIIEIVRKKGKRKNNNKEWKGVVYKIKCKDCEMMYIGETKKKMEERLKQHKDDVRLKRNTNAIFKHIEDTGHTVDWDTAEIIEQESRKVVRKWKEARKIKEIGSKAMNWNNGLAIDSEWEEVLKREERRRKKEENKRKKEKREDYN